MSPASRLLFLIMIIINQQRCAVSAFVDSGAEQSLISKESVDRFSIPTHELQTPLTVMSITGQNLTQIQLKTLNIHLIISGNHHKDNKFFVLDSPRAQLILGFPWLKKHNPMINRAEKRVEKWSPFYLQNCLKTSVTVLKRRKKG